MPTPPHAAHHTQHAHTCAPICMLHTHTSEAVVGELGEVLSDSQVPAQSAVCALRVHMLTPFKAISGCACRHVCFGGNRDKIWVPPTSLPPPSEGLTARELPSTSRQMQSVCTVGSVASESSGGLKLQTPSSLRANPNCDSAFYPRRSRTRLSRRQELSALKSPR